jgi:hypothetical protein
VAMAKATPTMFPVPMVADNAVQSDAELDMSPLVSVNASFSSFRSRYLIACFKRKTCKNFNLKEKYTLTNTRIEISGIPQITRLMAVNKSFSTTKISSYFGG